LGLKTGDRAEDVALKTLLQLLHSVGVSAHEEFSAGYQMKLLQNPSATMGMFSIYGAAGKSGGIWSSRRGF
jgi:hypothetical protein